MKKIILILVFLLHSPFLFAQKQGQLLIDSLQNEYKYVKSDTDKALILIILSGTYNSIAPEQGINTGKEALEISNRVSWKKGIGWAENNLAINYLAQTEYSTSLEYAIKALKTFESIGEKTGIALSMTTIAKVYCHQGSPAVALDYDNKAIKIFDDLGDKNNAAATLSDLVPVYYSLANYTKAMDCIYKSLKIYEELGNKYGIAKNYKYIGDCKNWLGNSTESLDWYFKALKINEELQDKNGTARNLEAIGNIYTTQKDFPKALKYKFQALKSFEELGDKYLITNFLGSIGNTYLEIAKNTSTQLSTDSLIPETKFGNLHKALEYGYSAIKNGTEINAQTFVATSYGIIGEAYLEIVRDSIDKITPDSIVFNSQKTNLAKAIEYLNKSIETSQSISNLVTIISYSKSLSDAYWLSGDYLNALHNFKLYSSLKDSVFSSQNKIKITNLETQRDLDLKQKDIELKDKQLQIDKLEVVKKKNERVFFIICIVLLFIVILIIFRSFKTQKTNNKQLKIEKQRSDDLLLNILPAEVADELKNKGSADAKYFDNVSVIFTDFKGFTTIAEKLTPQQLVNELDTCFKAFDDIIGKYNIEKIKTVGDAYLAVAGLPTEDPKHAYNVVNAAMEILHFMKERKTQIGEVTFDIRIGIHSGSVVAGIVGLKKFAYDIWGDTVNTASRMEQNSEPGKINISESTYELVKDKFECEFRGEINAENKGDLKMYFVTGYVAEPHLNYVIDLKQGK